MDSPDSLEQDLHNKIAQFDDIFRNLPEAAVLNSLDRRIVYLNPAACAMFGYAAEELIGQSPQLLYANVETYQQLGQTYTTIDSDFQQPAIEVQFRRKDGEAFPAEMMGTVVRSPSNALLGLLSIIRDISDRRAMENALRVKEAQLRQIIDLVPHMIFVKNREGRFLMVNKAEAALYGLTVDQLTGTHMRDHHLPDDMVDQFLEDDRGVIDSGEPRTIDEEVLHDAKGDVHIVQTMKIPYTLTGVAEKAVLGIAIDLTRQKQSELMLRQANALLETSRNVLNNLIAQLPIGIQIFNRHGICVDVNQAFLEIFGVEDVGQLINTYNIFEDGLADMMGTSAAAHRALEGEAVQLGDLTFDFAHADGRFARTSGERIINVIIFPVLNRQGNVTNIVGMNTDVTERTVAEQTRLEVAIHKERIDVLEELISTISHDFKTPLTIIGTSLYLFEKITKDENASKHIRRIEE